MIRNPQLDCVVSDHTQAVLLSGCVLAAIPPFLPEKMTEPAFMAWVRQHRVDCVLTLSTFRNAANPMQAWLAAGSLDCPRNLGLVSLDVTTATSTWAGIDQDSDEIGRAAVDLILSKVRAGERSIPKVHRSLLVHCCWREGNTVRAGWK